MQLSEIMTTDIVSVTSDDAASAAWSLMQDRRVRHLLVMKKNRLVGILSERDLGGRNGAPVRVGRTAQELMTPKVIKAAPKTTLRQAANLMRGGVVGCLPVVDEGRVVGIVTATDVLDALGRGDIRPQAGEKRPNPRIPAGSRQIDGIEKRVERARSS
jgi:acetoin utilization protein AcuB